MREADNLTTFMCRMSWKCGNLNLIESSGPHLACYGTALPVIIVTFDVLSTVHNSIELFHQPPLMQNFLYSLTKCLLHYYPRHVSSINVPIFRRKNSIHTASDIFALCKRLHSTLVESGLRSQPVYCADVYRERRYQMLCEYNSSS